MAESIADSGLEKRLWQEEMVRCQRPCTLGPDCLILLLAPLPAACAFLPSPQEWGGHDDYNNKYS